MLDACGLVQEQMPALYEGNAATGTLRSQVAGELGLPVVPVAAGAGDNAAGAIGSGAINEGDSVLSLGTSGVLFVANERFAPAAHRGAHAFCHALPERWQQTAVILSAAACLDWVARLTGQPDVAGALRGVEQTTPFSGPEIFLPYLSGERTPHNDPHASGVFFGLHADSDGPALVRAVLEGVALALADGLDALREAGTRIESTSVTGGGARSAYWGRILAAALGLPSSTGTMPMSGRRSAQPGSPGWPSRASARTRCARRPPSCRSSSPTSLWPMPRAPGTHAFAPFIPL
jgi:xylulokinase